MGSTIKQEPIETSLPNVELNPKKKRRVEDIPPPPGFEHIRPEIRTVAPNTRELVIRDTAMDVGRSRSIVLAQQPEAKLASSCKQFWKAGDYEGCSNDNFSGEDMDHVRVHPKFLHSNATSHKWVLGAFAELLDNASDEVSNGASYVHVDVLENMKDKSKMLMVQDNGGGMTPARMRQCMSLGYSAKSRTATTIGEYGNGFKTGTMRLGADVIVFSRCKGTNGQRSTRSIGLLSYTFLRATRKQDISVPMIDYERNGEAWRMYAKSNSDCWTKNLATILQWSPYRSEDDLLRQFNFMSEQGTRIIVYNLWEDEQGSLELDFDSDEHDIQIRGEDRDPKKMEVATKYPGCWHFFTYRHSLRSYAAILYRKIPDGFRIMLRGKEVDHYNIVDDLIYTCEHVYRPTTPPVKLGFVKASKEEHVDIQGFNVYHKNRLIEPFWRVCNVAGSDGRGVVGVLEANFIKPAHDKQGFERTNLLSKLEKRLKAFQNKYWKSNKGLIGYQSKACKERLVSPENKASTSLPVTRNTRHHESPPTTSNATSTPDQLEDSVVPQLDHPSDKAIGNTTTHGDESASFSSVVDEVYSLKRQNSDLKQQCELLKNELKDTKKKLVEMEKKLEERNRASHGD